MKPDKHTELAYRLAAEASRLPVLYVILFGSVAKGTHKRSSDVDILVVFDRERSVPKRLQKELSDMARKAEGDTGISIGMVLANRKFTGLDPYFVQKVFSEGIVLYASSPSVVLNDVPVRPMTFIHFNLERLDQADKMRFRNALYGYETSKRVGRKRYVSKHTGVLEECGGRRIGRGVVMAPTGSVGPIEKTLDEFKATYSRIDSWLFA
jgi:predicted nucleotidyltransferase